MPPRSTATQKIVKAIKWMPFGFIIGLIAFAFIVLIDLQVRYNLSQRHYYVSSLGNIAITCALAGMSTWAFMVAVFKHPGHPSGTAAQLGKGWDSRPMPQEDAIQTSGETRWERRERKRDEARRQGLDEDNLSASDTEDASIEPGVKGTYADAYDDEGTGTSYDNGAAAPLLQGEQRHPTTGAFDSEGPAAFLPGQPQVPSRSGRAQLDDLMTIVSHARQHRGDGRVFLSGLQVKNTGARRWCHKCACEKPDRAHHCSACGVCVLRMDHHCPWLASRCIGLRNHKAFFLFLAYTTLMCCYAAQMTARELTAWVEKEPQGYETTPISWAIIMFTGFIFGVALIPFTAYHAYLILRNRTTLESMEGSGRVRISLHRSADLPPRESVSDRLRRLANGGGDEDERPTEATSSAWKRDDQLTREERRALKRANKLNIYDLGYRANWRAVMGPKWPMWLIPIGDPESDGQSFEVNITTLQKVEEATASIRGDTQESTRNSEARAAPARGLSRVSSVRGQIRSGIQAMGKSEPQKSQAARIGSNAHGKVAWGASPRRDFVLYDVHDDEDDEYARHGNDTRASGVLDTNAVAARQQQDADVWSS